MLFKDLVLLKFRNGFRILQEENPDDKFFVIDDVELEIGDIYVVGPNGYFEYKGKVREAEAMIKEALEQ